MVKQRVRQAWLWSRHNPVTLVLVVSALFAWAALADTRHDTEVIERTVQQSPCTLAPASEACQSSKRESDRERSVADTCIAFRKVGYRCPVGEARARVERREGVVSHSSRSASQPPGPSRGDQPHVPDEPDGTPVTDKPSGPPSKPSRPSNPSNPTGPSKPSTPPSEPTQPSQPTSPAPRPIQVNAPGVTVDAGNGGICAGAAGIRLGLGDC